MTGAPAAGAERSRWAPSAGIVLTGLAGLIALARLRTWDEPPAPDPPIYAVIAHELRSGRWLYVDVWDHKPPAIHVSYYLAETVAGYGLGQIYLLSVGAAVLTLVGVYAAGRALGGRAGGLWAAGFWALIWGDVWVQGNQPTPEAFISACLVGALALLAAPGRGRALAAGVLVALAVLYKPVAAMPGVALLVARVIAPPRAMPRRRALAEVGLTVGAAGVVAGAVLGYFAASGRLRALLDAVVVYNRFFAGSLTANLGDGVTPARLFPSALSGLWPLGALAVPGLGVGLRWGPRSAWGLVAAYLIATPFAIALAGRFSIHYYQLWLPPLALAAGGALGVVLSQPVARSRRWAWLAGTGVALLLLAYQLPVYARSAAEWSRIKHGEHYLVMTRLGRELDGLLAPGETFYTWLTEPLLYFVSRRSPPSGLFLVNPLVYGPLAATLTARALRDLEQRPPELLVAPAAALGRPWPAHPILAWLHARYRPLPGDPVREGVVALYARRGGALEARLAGGARPAP